ncbi:hypothetical protein BKA67DRAFT_655471 [Truncatella angustata]|uniref:Uncharacterized protein n=1 Tax=Truncatella angustata TaxID=152316 RepID=A0A9P9A0E4_9PEZI|nr:uncharacterized protein BKA67DRAFT_655471 [Truncatella angustata]KAH6657183.1 hypothetical protein BKA67DRAFT_655471 [Truncatella angustata]
MTRLRLESFDGPLLPARCRPWACKIRRAALVWRLQSLAWGGMGSKDWIYKYEQCYLVLTMSQYSTASVSASTTKSLPLLARTHPLSTKTVIAISWEPSGLSVPNCDACVHVCVFSCASLDLDIPKTVPRTDCVTTGAFTELEDLGSSGFFVYC